MSGTLDPPALDLDFTQATMPGGVTFTRASTATYFDVTGTLQTAATNAARLDYDPVTHLPRGLLVEEARTNLFLQSGDFTNASWLKVNATLAAGTPGPNGATTGSGVIAASGAIGILQQSVTVAAGTAYTASVFVKAAGQTSVQISLPSGWWADAIVRYGQFNLSTGVVIGVGGGTATAAMVPVGNGWYRISVTATPDTAGAAVPHIARSMANGDGTTVSYYAWGAQIEAGGFATSYIATLAATVTRINDVTTMTPLGAWFKINEGTLSFEFDNIRTGATVVTGGFSSGAFANCIYFTINTATTFVNSTGITASSGTVSTNGTVQKSALSYSSSGGVLSVSNNGSAGASNNALGAGPFLWSSNLSFGTAPWSPGSNNIDGHIRRVRFWSRAFSSAELQQVTLPDTGPSLDMDLTQGTLPSGLTLTRSTTGTYVDNTGTIRTAAINTPRFGYHPSTLAPLGLLIEEARTNLNFPSGDQSGTGWASSPAGCVLMTPNQTTAPDGTNTATSVVTNDTSANSHAIFRAFSGAINTTYVGSLFVKANAYPRVSLTFGNTAFPAGSTGGLFDLTTGTIVATNGVTVCTITPYPNGWYRVSSSATSTGTGGAYVYTVYICPATVSSVGGNYTPASTGLGIFTWGSQVETSAFITAPSSYIPTTTTTVARTADLCSMPAGAPWYSPTLGSFAVDATMQQVGAGNQDIVGFDDGSISNCTIARCTANQFYIVEASGGVGQASANTQNTIVPGVPFRAAMTYNAGVLTGALNGGAVVTSTGTPPVSSNRLNLSAIRQATQNGFKSRIRYWPRVLSNIELQELTSTGVQARAMVLA